MKSPTKTPFSIKLIAFIFIAIGITIFIESLLTFSNAMDDSLNVLPVVAVIGAILFCVGVAWVGIGLLRLSPKSRHFALGLVWIIMGATACVVTLISIAPTPSYEWKGQSLGVLPTVPSVGVGALVFALFYWKHCVLIHSTTRRLFEPEDH